MPLAVGPTGDLTLAHVRVGPALIIVSVPPSLRLAADDRVRLGFDQRQLHLFAGHSEEALADA